MLVTMVLLPTVVHSGAKDRRCSTQEHQGCWQQGSPEAARSLVPWSGRLASAKLRALSSGLQDPGGAPAEVH